MLLERYQVTKTGEQFVSFDSGVGDNKHVLIYATKQGIHFSSSTAFSSNSHWFMDGTFKIYPEIFYQVYTILH